MDFEQRFAAICGNGHAATQLSKGAAQPGVGEVPKLCAECSAPIFTSCTCGRAILGERLYPGVIGFELDPPPWFCHDCGKPYHWATSEQIRSWVENRIKFDEDLDDDARFELLDVLAVLTPSEPDAPPMDFSAFRNLMKRTGAVYEEVKPLLPMLRGLFAS